MAAGIRTRHGRSCRSRGGGRCNCAPSYEAGVYSKREGKKIRKTFGTLAEARAGGRMRRAPSVGGRCGRRPRPRWPRLPRRGLRERGRGRSGTARATGISRARYAATSARCACE
jgi:hypothetical protein